MVENIQKTALTDIQKTADEARKAEELRKKAEEQKALESQKPEGLKQVAATEPSKETDKIEAKKDTRLTGYKENLKAPTIEEAKQQKEAGGLSVRDLLKKHEENQNNNKVKV